MNAIEDITKNILNNIISGSTVKEKEGDYLGAEGLLYCGYCHTKKERYIRYLGELDKKVPCVCKCQKEANNERNRQYEYREKVIEIRRIRDSSMMDSKFQDARFSSYSIVNQNRKVYQIAKKYTDNFSQMLKDNQGLIFWGPVGTGKSFTAACIANDLIDKQIPVIMTSFVKILQNLSNWDESKYISLLNSASLLILDDLGTERNTDYALEKVYNVVDSRSREKKPMILTTNMTLNEMLEVEDVRYKRIYDRIFEICLPVEVSGVSFRKIAAEQRFEKMAKFMEG